MNDTQLQANIRARQDAETVFALCGDHQPARFWEVLAELVATKLPPKPQPVERLPAFTEQEAIDFEKQRMPWGNHLGKPVGEVPVDYMLFVTEGDEFSKMLKRYVKSKVFSDRQED